MVTRKDLSPCLPIYCATVNQPTNKFVFINLSGQRKLGWALGRQLGIGYFLRRVQFDKEKYTHPSGCCYEVVIMVS